MTQPPNYTDKDVFDAYLVLSGKEYFARRYVGLAAADRACLNLEDRYRGIGGRAIVKTITPQKRGQATGAPSVNGHPPR